MRGFARRWLAAAAAGAVLAVLCDATERGTAGRARAEDVSEENLAPDDRGLAEKKSEDASGSGAAGQVKHGLGEAGTATREAIEEAGRKTGEALDKALQKTGEGVGTVVEKTGEKLREAGDALSGEKK